MPAINIVKLSAGYCVKSTSFISWQLSQECGKNESSTFLPAAIFRMEARRGSSVASAFLDLPRQRSDVPATLCCCGEGEMEKGVVEPP
ncbi:hypothetical protein [Janthinobacterium sp. HH106]|uniref:hypothetical protein n=1 Tax=Janthinobacterium sp. HH106 TaxID=1537278 RepID=UPI00111322A6|nr:hypothetical protein [Janthinobacterium sp. HH106]